MHPKMSNDQMSNHCQLPIADCQLFFNGDGIIPVQRYEQAGTVFHFINRNRQCPGRPWTVLLEQSESSRGLS